MNDATELTPENLLAIRKILADIEEKSADGDYIYRGECKNYKKVSSSLYREYEKKIDADNFDINFVEEEILKSAQAFTTDRDDQSILTSLQHYGGKTNLIDFSQDYRVALFFSCNSAFRRIGRVILVNKKKMSNDEVISPKPSINRVITQSSIFIRPAKGFLPVPDRKTKFQPGAQIVIVSIPVKIKEPILRYLKKYHDISSETVFNDLHGFITERKIHQSAYTEFYKGLTFQNKENFKDAILRYSEALELNPQHTPSYNNRGVSHHAQEDYDKAIDDFTQAIAIDSQYAEIYYNRGSSYASSNRRQEAIADFTQAIMLDSEHADAYCNRGNSHSALKEYQQAIADYTKAIEINPQLAEAYWGRGFCHAVFNRHQQAIADFTQAIMINPQFAGAYSNRGNSHANLELYPQAIADYTKAIEINPEFTMAYYSLGCAKHFNNKQQGWDSDLRSALDLAKAQGNTELEANIRQAMLAFGMSNTE